MAIKEKMKNDKLYLNKIFINVRGTFSKPF